MGVVSMQKGDIESARPLFEEATSTMERVLGAEHPALSGPLDNLGVSLWYLADYDAARAHYQRALAISEKSLGPRHDDVAGSLLNLALVSRALGDHEEAGRLLTRAIAILEGTFGAQHPEVANLVLEMATLRATQGNDAEADRLYGDSLAVFAAATPGLDHPSVAYSQACYWAVRGRPEEALHHLERSLELGYSKPFFLNPDFDSLRGDPAYEAIVAAFKADRSGRE
jgi:tetratricopeptide (TPR) repeat protein